MSLRLTSSSFAEDFEMIALMHTLVLQSMRVVLSSTDFLVAHLKA